jgi:acetoin utilization deacetylase AcuC-like enzyme
MGGYCYFNNAALAAERLLRLNSQARRVAILDLDIHHGNGTQDIFYESDRVPYTSIHLIPAEGYPPHSGFAPETGSGAGVGFNLNQPLPVGTTWPAYAEALERALDWMDRTAPSYLVVSQGFDTFEGDRWGGFLLRAEHFAAIGERLRGFGKPVLAVLEGGYEPANLAAGSLALLEGLGGD